MLGCGSAGKFKFLSLLVNQLQGRWNVGRAGGWGRKKLRAMENYEKQIKSLPIIRPVTRRGAGLSLH